jgi:hypothetical protein
MGVAITVLSELLQKKLTPTKTRKRLMNIWNRHMQNIRKQVKTRKIQVQRKEIIQVQTRENLVIQIQARENLVIQVQARENLENQIQVRENLVILRQFLMM